MDRVPFGLPDSRVYSGEEECSGEQGQSSRPGSSHGMVPSSEGLRGDLLGVWLYPSRPLCRLLGSGTHSSTPGTICLPMPSHPLLCSGRFCRECVFRPGSHWFWWRRCGHRKCLIDLLSLLVDRPLELLQVWNLLIQPHVWKFYRGLGTLRLKLIQRLVRKASFSKVVVQVAAGYFRLSTAALYQTKWSRFPGWCDRLGVDPCKVSVLQKQCFFYSFAINLACLCLW